MALAVAGDGSVYLGGETNSLDFPTVGFAKPLGAGGEGFLVKLNAAGSSIEFGGVLGGVEDDVVTGVTVDSFGNALLAGVSHSDDFPVTEGAVQRNPSQSLESVILKIAGTSSPALARIVSSANLVNASLAPTAIATAFAGGGMSTSVEQAQPPAAALGGATMAIKDKFGTERAASMFYASPVQINFLVPTATALGPAEVLVRVGGQVVARGSARIDQVAPGLYAANSNGLGTAAAVSTTVELNGTQTLRLTFACGVTPLSCVGDPIVVGDGSRPVYISLFGTGIRGKIASVTATVAGQNMPIQYDGPQNQFPGLDQVNIGPLPASLAGSGVVEVVVTVDDIEANTLTLTIQ